MRTFLSGCLAVLLLAAAPLSAQQPAENQSAHQATLRAQLESHLKRIADRLDGVQVDAGYVMLKGRPYIAAFMTTYLSKDAEGGEAIGEASRAVFDYFDRIGAEGSYGRRIR